MAKKLQEIVERIQEKEGDFDDVVVIGIKGNNAEVFVCGDVSQVKLLGWLEVVKFDLNSQLREKK